MGRLDDPRLAHLCPGCRKVKAWYNFQLPVKDPKNPGNCFKCLQRQDRNLTLIKLERLITMSTKNKMTDLRNHLFEAMERVKEGEMPIDRAKTLCEIAQVIINSAKVEVDFLKMAGLKKNGFLEIEA